jgi:hypothetical protein
MKKTTNSKQTKPTSKADAMLRRAARLAGENVEEFRERAALTIRPSIERALAVYAIEIPTIERKAILALEVLYGVKRHRTGTIGGIVEAVSDYLALRENRRGREIDEIVNGIEVGEGKFTITPLFPIVERMMDDANAKAGLSKPPPMPAPWFEQVTGRALQANALRKTTKNIKKFGAGRTLRFCPESVKKAYPEVADLIDAGLRRLT